MPSVVTSKPANDGHPKTGQRRERQDKVFYSFSGNEINKRFDSQLKCRRPERRIGQRWEALRALTQEPKTKAGCREMPRFVFELWDWRKAINPSKRYSRSLFVCSWRLCFRTPTAWAAFQDVTVMQQSIEHGGDGRRIAE